MWSTFIWSPFIASPFIWSPFVASPFMASPFIWSCVGVSDFIVSSADAPPAYIAPATTKAKAAKLVMMEFIFMAFTPLYGWPGMGALLVTAEADRDGGVLGPRDLPKQDRGPLSLQG